MQDNPTQNHATLNPLKTFQTFSSGTYLSNANLRSSNPAQNQSVLHTPTIAFPEKEQVFLGVQQIAPTTTWGAWVGLFDDVNDQTSTWTNQSTGLQWNGTAWMLSENGISGANVTWNVDDWLYFAYDRADSRVRMWINDTLISDSTTVGPDLSAFYNKPYNTRNFNYNFGQIPYAHNVDPFDGAGNLQTQNLPEAPITDGRDHFQVVTTGTGSGQSYAQGEIDITDPFVRDASEEVRWRDGSLIDYVGVVTLDAGQVFNPLTFGLQHPTRDYRSSFQKTVRLGPIQEKHARTDRASFYFNGPARYIRFGNGGGTWQGDYFQGVGTLDVLGAARTAFDQGLWWIKDRVNEPTQHQLVDSVRGDTTFTCPGETNGPYVAPTGNSVAWCWNAPDEWSANVGDNGATLASSGRRNLAAGFSIATYTGNLQQNASLNHGLDGKPEFAIYKNTNTTDQVMVHEDLEEDGNVRYLFMSDTNAGGSAPLSTGHNNWNENLAFQWNDTISNGNGNTIVAYYWRSIPGYSAFGSYRGNGTGGDGSPFVYLGFRPAFLMIKCATAGTAGVHNWWMHDTTRAVNNPSTNPLAANVAQGEYDFGSALIDINSNGFKLRGGPDQMNGNQTYLYFAFAENPFGSSNTSPATAR